MRQRQKGQAVLLQEFGGVGGGLNMFKLESMDAVPDLKNRVGRTKYTAVISKHVDRLPTE